MDRDGSAAQPTVGAILDLRMLGPLEAWQRERRLPLGGRRQRAVLACLLLDPDHDVSMDRIVDAVWGEHPPSSVLSTLQALVFHLREALEPSRAKGAAPTVLVTVPGGYRLQTSHATIDVKRFDDLILAGRRSVAADPAAAAEKLGEALALWRGDVLSDVAPMMTGYVGPVAARLAEARVLATELHAEAELALGDPGVLSTLDDLVARYPLREHPAALRMLALYRAGRQADALAAYRQLQRTLDDELGIQPSAEAQTMQEQILRQDSRLDPGPRRPPVGPAKPAEPAEPVASVEPGNPVISVEPAEPPRPAEPLGLVETTRSGRPDPVQPKGSRRGVLRGLSRRWWAAATAILIFGAATVVGATFVLRRADVTWLPANSVAPIDARGFRGDAALLDSAPSDLVSAGGALWAVEGDAHAVARIDPQDRRVTQTVRGVGRTPQAAAAMGDDLWVVAFGDDVLTRVDLRSAQAGHQIALGTDPVAVVAGPGGVWVANSGDNTVMRIDPQTERADPPIFVGDGPSALALEGSTLWVTNGRSGTVSQIDTRTGERMAADIRVDAGPSALAITETDVWVANEGGQSVSRIPRTTGRPQRIEVDDGPSSVVVIDNQVWVTNRYSAKLTRIDARTNDVTRIDVRSAGSVLAVVDGEVWVGSGASAPEHRGGTLAWEGTLLQPTVDPATAYFPTNSSLLRSVYDSLVAFRMGSGRSSLGLVPDLATDLPEPSDGGRTYVFTIRAGIRYSTGGVVKASDFLRGMQRALQPTAANPSLLTAVVGVSECLAVDASVRDCDINGGMTADDDSGRVTLHLREPDPELLEKLSLLLYPVPAGTPLENQGWTPLPGTGPYAVTSAGPEKVTLSRNPHFHQWSAAAQPDGYPDVITYRLQGSESVAVAHVLNGTAAGTFTDEPLPVSVTSRSAFLQQYELLDLQMLYPNASVPPFDDRRVRQALNFAVDRNTAARMADPSGDSATPTCQLIPEGIPGHRFYCPYQTGAPDAPYQGPDLAKARALVAESGTTGIPIVVYYGPYPSLQQKAEYAATVLRDLGYQVSVEPAQLDAAKSVTNKYQIQAQLGWIPDYPLPGTYFDGQVRCGQAILTHYCNPAIEALAGQARSLRRSDPAQSLALWTQVDRMLVDDGALVPLVNRVGTVVVHPDIGNVMTRAGFGPLLDQMWVK